ncbi:inactive ubiquitin carboxyl-terminal hydrolase 53-like [Mobula birostris]|uniref:inactive ubiquitin carboxyl-terminal hydrolase 53-like n=1 Tax=Mobula birostris TaxID=1983395 RepID=UPI003B2897C0
MAWMKQFLKPGGNLRNSYQPGSMLSIAPTKGLLNGPGENSCFLNSAVQILWHLDIFRRSLRQLPGHVCFGNACIFCALKDIFVEFRNSREKALPSDALRSALAESFKDEHRFQLGFMDDAAECFENILERIHSHMVSDMEMDTCTAKCCITHQKFAMTLYEQSVCHSCGATSDPLPFTELVHYVSITALCNQVDRMLERNERPRPELFAELLQAASTVGDYRNCPSNCGQKIKIRRVLMNCPEIVTIGLVWDSENSDLTLDVIRYLALQLHLPGLFFRATDEFAKRSELFLVGMVCYSNRHYCTFAFHTKSSKWIFFDDANVKEVGSKWKDVVSKCNRGHFQPLLLFYANPYGMPVSTEDAPRQVFHPVHYKLDGEDSEKEMQISATRVSDYEKVNGVEGRTSKARDLKLPLKQPSNAKGGFQRGYIQDSRGRGLIKVFPDGSSFSPMDCSNERAQKPGNGRNPPHNQKKENDKPRTDYIKQRDDRTSKSGASHFGNSTRHFSDQHAHSQGKGYLSEGRTTTPIKAISDKYASDSIQHKKSMSSTGYDTDTSQDSRDRSNSRSRNKGKVWKPSRETLNVDSIFEEEGRRQSSPKHKSNTAQQVLHRKGQNTNDLLYEKRKHKDLKTIYEDEFKQGIASPLLEVDGKAHLENEKSTDENLKTHSSGYRVQKMESGHDSSSWFSGGSTNHDPQSMEISSGKNLKRNQDAFSQRSQVTLIKTDRFLDQPSRFSDNEANLQENEYKPRDKTFHKPNMQRSHFDKSQASSSPSFERARKAASIPSQNPRFQESPGINLQDNKPYKDNEYHPQTQLKQSFTDKSAPKSSVNSKVDAMSLLPDPCEFPSEDFKKASLVSNRENYNLQDTDSTVHVLSSNSQQVEKNTAILPPVLPVHLHPVESMSENSLSNQRMQSGGLSSHHCFETKENVLETVHNIRSSPPPLPPKKYNRRIRSNLDSNALNFRQVNVLKEQKENPVLSEVTANVTSRFMDASVVPLNEVPQAIIQEPALSPADISDHEFLHNRAANLPEKSAKLEANTASVGLVKPVAPTTYFSVDGCMTDTYRVKYHERPKLYFADMKANESVW